MAESFELHPGRILARKYEVVSLLGAGWEGEVYKVRELATGIDRAAKFFFPERNPRDKNARFYAKKLHKLRHCPILIQYHAQDQIAYKGKTVTFLISDYVEGELLSRYLARQPGQRMSAFAALQLLYALADGMSIIHGMGEYHGDLHTDNIILRRYGLGYDVKLLDMFQWGAATRAHIADDVCDLVRILYDAVGGAKHYAKQPPEIKTICSGLKRSLILANFRTAGELCEHLETIEWTS
ncbi:MAG: protein kinase [Polyangiales bacterium]|jgi:serine/threonine protein kinase